jgi:exopolysaccharide biosynthesis polyprenyl glycosylphosphotransferase
MSPRMQPSQNWLSFSTSTAAAPALAPAPPIPGSTGGEPSPQTWLNSGQTDKGGAAKIAAAHVVGGVWVQVVYALIDFSCVVVNGVLAFLLAHPTAGVRHVFTSAYKEVVTHQPLSGYGGFLMLYAALVLLFCQGQDLYRTPRMRPAWQETFGVAKSVTLPMFLLSGFIYLTGANIVARFVVMVSPLMNFVALSAWRYAKRRVVIHRVEQGIGARNAVIIGAGRVGEALARQLEENKLLGYRFKGFLDENPSGGSRLLGTVDDLPRIARAEFVDDVFITIPSERELVKRVALEARSQGINVKIVPDLYDGLAWNVPLHRVGDFPVMDVRWKPIPTLGFFLKRLMDISFSLVGLILYAPLLALLAAGIKLDSPGPVFYRSRRVGRKGRVFNCLKLRTMVANADELKTSVRHLNERKGPFFKITCDPRVTRLGKWLRKYSLDEFPQLWNVFIGDMSLVGPRPHPLDDYAQYTLEQLRRLEVRPGMTGLWQVTARQEPAFETSMALDLKYIDGWSLPLDFKLLLWTIPAVFKGLGQ